MGEARMVARARARGERRQHPGMQFGAARCRDRTLDRLTRELVPEAEDDAVVDQDAACERFLDRRDALRRDLREQVGRDTLPDYRRGIDHAAGLWTEAADAGEGRIPHRGRDPLS